MPRCQTCDRELPASGDCPNCDTGERPNRLSRIAYKLLDGLKVITDIVIELLSLW